MAALFGRLNSMSEPTSLTSLSCLAKNKMRRLSWQPIPRFCLLAWLQCRIARLPRHTHPRGGTPDCCWCWECGTKSDGKKTLRGSYPKSIRCMEGSIKRKHGGVSFAVENRVRKKLYIESLTITVFQVQVAALTVYFVLSMFLHRGPSPVSENSRYTSSPQSVLWPSALARSVVAPADLPLSFLELRFRR